MSQTIAGLIVLVLGLLGLQVAESDVLEVVTALMTVVGIVWTYWGRYRQGDINVVGIKK